MRLVAILLVAIGTWGGLGYRAITAAAAKANGGINASARSALSPSGGFLSGAENTLVIGADIDPGQTLARADSIMIVRTDPHAGRIKYLSITYDMMVPVPGYGQQKISAAMAYLGQRGIIRAVAGFTGIPINHLVVINYPAAIHFIDSVGGVTVTNPFALHDCAYPGGTHVSFPRGVLHLDGARALQFARVRQCDSDFQRQDRQQLVAQAVKAKVLSFPDIWQAPWTAASAIQGIDTDMSANDLIELGWQLHSLSTSPADHIVLAGTPTVIGGIDYVVANPAADRAQIARFLGPT